MAGERRDISVIVIDTAENTLIENFLFSGNSANVVGKAEKFFLKKIEEFTGNKLDDQEIATALEEGHSDIFVGEHPTRIVFLSWPVKNP